MYILLFLILAAPSLSLIVDNLTLLPHVNYDYIVVGAGTAGSVIASRLSEAPDVNVLLIEAGGQDTGHPESNTIQIPGLAAKASTNTIFDWNDTSTAQIGLGNRTVKTRRGHVLGGSSSTNFMAYSRPSSDDYDKFAEVTGDEGWSWNAMLPYMLKNERHVESADGHNTSRQFLPSVHGTSGPVLTSLPGFPTDIDHRIIATTSELPDEFPFNIDTNKGTPLGVGWVHSSIGFSVRSSAATGYLHPAFNRSNLHILINTRVTRFVSVNSGAKYPLDFRGVEFVQGVQDPAAPRVTLVARKEVVSCAGTIGTAHLLLLSGIGDSEQLSRFQIKQLVNLTDVGKNMREHPFVPFQWIVNSTLTSDTVSQSAALTADALHQYQTNGTGPLVGSASNNVAFLRLAENSSIITQFGDISNGPQSPHIIISFSNGFVSTTQAPPSTGNYFTAVITPTSPFSRGSVTLASSSPFVDPAINIGILSEQPDAQAVAEGYRMVNRFLTASPWRNYIESPFSTSEDLTTDAGIIEYARRTAAGIAHYQGTAAASKADASTGVLNPDLTVKHTKGLRVVDASVFPITFTGYTQSIVYAVAERAVDLIKSSA